MEGQIHITQTNGFRVHTFTAPERGWHVNSHIIEFPSQLLVVDAQYLLPYAREVVAYSQQLKKPLTRLYITHYHPDHLLGAAAFSAPIYALRQVIAKIKVVGDREEHEKFGDEVNIHINFIHLKGAAFPALRISSPRRFVSYTL